MNLVNSLAAIVLVCLAGCSTSTGTVEPDAEPVDFYEMDSSALKRIRGMKIIPPFFESSSNYIDLGPVMGTYCQKDAIKNTQAAAIERFSGAHDQVKMRAAIKGADAISVPRCKSVPAKERAKGCQAQMSCRSKAFRQSAAAI